MPENTYSPIVINEEKQTPINGIHHLTTEEYYDLTHHTHDASELITVNDEDETVSIKDEIALIKEDIASLKERVTALET